MSAETLNCPMCGAPASKDATACDHCGARLATVACPSCFGMIFQGAKFCSHCGAKVERIEVDDATKEFCPRCKVDLTAVVIGKTNLRECPKCEGLWLSKTAFEKICDDNEEQAAVLGMAIQLPTDLAGNVEAEIRYLPCPLCKKLMNRVNFAHCSHVIVDVCAQHGTWFDKDELRRIVEFIRGGGLTKARIIEEVEAKRRLQLLEDQQRNFGAGSMSAGWNDDFGLLGRSNWSTQKYELVGAAVVGAAGLIARMLRK
jgi:Zn-finger nucleic acid-binding protein